MNEFIPVAGGDVPYFDQYLGLWLFEPTRFMRAADLVRGMNMAAHLQDQKTRLDRQQERREPDAQAPANGAKAEATTQFVRRGYSYEIVDGVAMLQLEGTLMKHASSYDDSTSTAMARNTVRKMRIDPLVRGVILIIDSPGGTVSGAYDLAKDIEQLAKAKPTYAYGENCLCSAAYLMAAMTRGISTNENCITGSIGTYGAVYDYSKMFEKEGVKVVLLSSGGMKGAGLLGTEITQEQIDEWQKEINELNDLFIKYVAAGRSMTKEKVTELADGRVYVGKAAVKVGLVQKIETLDQLFSRVRQEIGGPAAAANGATLQGFGIMTENDKGSVNEHARGGAAHAADTPADSPHDDDPTEEPADASGKKKKDKMGDNSTQKQAEGGDADVPTSQGAAAESIGGDAMSQTNNGTAPAQGKAEQPGEPKPASIAELKAAFPNDSAFALDCAEQALTMTEAKAKYADVLTERNAALSKENAELKDKGKPVGNKGLSEAKQNPNHGGGGDEGGAIAEYESRVANLMTTRKMSREAAAAKVLGDDEDLRARFNQERIEQRQDNIRRRVTEAVSRHG